MENWFGRNVIGVIASVLVFLGILFLGFLVVPSLGDAVKILLMFVFSTLLTAGGAALTLTKKNNFTIALLGCGCGSFFISIMLTHAFFHAIPDIAAFALLLVWLAGSLALVKVSDSVLVSVIAHSGMIISLCFAYAVGLSEDRLALILIYHALSVGLIIAGNKLCCQRTQNLGLFASLFLSLIAVITMLSYYGGVPVSVVADQFGYALAAFAIQLVGAAVLSLVLTASILRIESAGTRIVLQLLNMALFFMVILVSTFLFPEMLVAVADKMSGFLPSVYPTTLIPTITATVFSAAYLFGMLALCKKLQAKNSFTQLCVIASCSVIALFTLGLYSLTAWDYPSSIRLTGLMVVVAILVICQRLTKDATYLWVANAALALDFSLMVLSGYEALVLNATIAAGLGYLALFIGALAYLWSQIDEAEKASLRTPFKVLMLVIVELSIYVIFEAAYIAPVYALLLITFGFLGLFLRRFDARDSKQAGFWTFMRIHEMVLVLVNCVAIETSSEGITQIFALILAVASIALLACSIRSISATPRGKEWIAVLDGILFTLVILTTISGLSTWLKEPYVLSLALMASALVCIGVGFGARIKALRLYGLIIIIGCVLKLVTFDIGNAETIMRVVAFIVGGLICFGISALYTYMVKRLDTPKIV